MAFYLKSNKIMASIFQNIPKYCVSYSKSLCTSGVVSAHWNKDWIPKPYPLTEKERQIAAEKYNLHRKEYIPHPDDGLGYGDYPKLPTLGVSTRDPFYPYDNPEHRRNFNEAVHAEIDMLGEDRIDAGASERYSPTFMVATTILVFGFLFGSCYATRDIFMFQPVMKKQYPWQKETHYTFDKC